MKRVDLAAHKRAARDGAKPTTPVETMKTIADRICGRMGENATFRKKTAANIIANGDDFKRAKAKAKKEDGVKWLDWLKKNNWAERFAQRCMSVHSLSLKYDNLSDLPIPINRTWSDS